MTDHITIDRKVAEQVLEALENNVHQRTGGAYEKQITAFRSALDAAKKVEPEAAKREWVDQQELKDVRELNKELGIPGMIGSPNWYDAMRKAFTAPPPAIPDGWREELELIRSVLNGFQPCMAKSDGLRAVNKLLATAPKKEESDMGFELPLERKNQLWNEFNEWHRQRYGWTLREDIKGQPEYEGAQAWFAWLEKARRDKEEITRLRIELRDTLAPDEDSPTPNAEVTGLRGFLRRSGGMISWASVPMTRRTR